MFRAIRILTLVSLLLLTLALSGPALADEQGVWSDASEAVIVGEGERWIVPMQYRTVILDATALDAVLQTAPMEATANASPSETILGLPMPDGSINHFRIEVSPVMAPELAAKFPELQTYRGQGIEDPTAIVRFDTTPSGFHAIILGVDGTIYIDPYRRGDDVHHISYYTGDYVNEEALEELRCHFEGEEASALQPPDRPEGVPNLPNGTMLRTYRTAVAATGEYTAFHSAGAPTVPEGMAAIVIAMNRVNGVYERDVAIRMTLVANNNLIVYTNGGTDPYTNNSGFAMLAENQANVDAVIGDANYDIGHVFSTGGGGIASLGVPCRSGLKARGVTGLGSPVGDVFYIDFVAHEMGHQWDGNHTFNGSSGNCAGGNRNGGTAYEPGSGTTIQAYAGICSPQNIQPNSDDHFHNISYQEIVNYSTTGLGNGCPVATATGNTPPTPDASMGGVNYTIPLNTPFELCGSATDPDGDTLTYNWEQFNLGPAGHPNSPVGDAAIFRSFSSTTSPCRTFPQLSDLLTNSQTLGEILPSYARTLTFRMLVRDNRAGGGGADYDQIDVEVSAVGDGFEVTSPNTAVTWTGGTTELVTWDVAGTTSAPISCSQVDILVSEDGGTSYATTVVSGVSNDGSQSITVPQVTTSTARLKVRCSGNVFFDISDSDFEILFTPNIFADGFESGDTTLWDATSP